MFLYIDPGTGSMLFSILIGVVSTAFFFGRQLFLKLKFIINGGKSEQISNTKLPIVIFSDHKRYWNVFKPICEELENRKINAVFWTASPDDPALTQNYQYVKCEFIGEGNKPFSKLNMLNADIVLATTPGLNVYQWKKSKNVRLYVHIFHEVGEPMTYRMFGLDYYDSILLSGDFQGNYIRYIENKRNLKAKELTTVGCTYFDEIKKRLDNCYSEKNIKKTILLAPSWGSTAILSKFGEKIIDALIATGFDIIIRPHPQSKTSEKELLDSLMIKYPDSESLHWNFDNDNFDVLNKSDILISDFSGVIFDFALCFDKPIIYADTNFDSSAYDAAWLEEGEELWRFKVLPELGIPLREKDFPEIKTIIEKLINDEKYTAGRERVRNEAWQNKGNSAAAIVDYLEKKLKENGGEK